MDAQLYNFSSSIPSRILRHSRSSCGSTFGCCARLDHLCNDGNRSRRWQRELADWQQRFRPWANCNLAKIEFIVVRTIAGSAIEFLFCRIITANMGVWARCRRGFIHGVGMHPVNTWGEKLQCRSLSTLFCICYAELGRAKTVRASEIATIWFAVTLALINGNVPAKISRRVRDNAR